MKTNFPRMAAMVFAVAALFLTQTGLAAAQNGPASPQALGEKLITAIKAQDKNALLALINPEVIDYMKKNDQAKLDESIQNWLNTKVPPNHEFVVQPVNQIPDYHANSKTLTFGSVTMYFPVAPTDFLVLIGDVEATVKEDGKDVVKKGRGPVTIDAVMQDKGVWYVVLPVITKTQQ